MKRTLTHLAFCAFTLGTFGGLAKAHAAEDLPERIVKMIERMAADTDANKPDCDKIAAALNKHADDDAKLIKEAKAAEKKDMEAKYGARMKAAFLKMAPLKECKTNEKIKAYRTKVGM